MLKRPIPDGSILIRFREPYNRSYIYQTDPTPGEEDFLVRYDFKHISRMRKDEEGFTIYLNNSSVTYPWSAIQEVQHIFNSPTYLTLLKTYQNQHEHTWVCTNEYSGSPADPMSGFLWYCGPNKDGSDIGCNASELRNVDDAGRTFEKVVEEMRNMGMGFGGDNEWPGW